MFQSTSLHAWVGQNGFQNEIKTWMLISHMETQNKGHKTG